MDVVRALQCEGEGENQMMVYSVIHLYGFPYFNSGNLFKYNTRIVVAHNIFVAILRNIVL